MAYVQSRNPENLTTYKAQLMKSGYPAEIVILDGAPIVQTSEEGKAWLLANLPGPNVQKEQLSPEMQKRVEANTFIFKVLGIGVLLVGLMTWWGGAFEPAPEAPKSELEQLYDKRGKEYAMMSEWGTDFRYRINREYLRNPNTAWPVDWRVIPNGQDSVTIVYAMTAENDFGVEKKHQITVSISVDTGDGRVVSFH